MMSLVAAPMNEKQQSHKHESALTFCRFCSAWQCMLSEITTEAIEKCLCLQFDMETDTLITPSYRLPSVR